MGLQTHHLSFLISQRRWRALKSTFCPFWSLKGDKEPSNPPFWYLQEVVEPSNPPVVHLKLFKVLGSMFLQTHHMCIYLGSSNPPSLLFDLSKEMKSPHIHYLSILISQRRLRALKSTILIPPRNCRALKSTTCLFKTIQSAWVYVPSNPPHVHLSWVFKPTISPFWSLKEIKSPQIHHFDTSQEL